MVEFSTQNLEMYPSHNDGMYIGTSDDSNDFVNTYTLTYSHFKSA